MTDYAQAGPTVVPVRAWPCIDDRDGWWGTNEDAYLEHVPQTHPALLLICATEQEQADWLKLLETVKTSKRGDAFILAK